MSFLERLDSIKNAITSMGTDRDPAEHRNPSGSPVLGLDELEEWLEHDRVVPHIVEGPAKESVRGGFEVKVGEERPFKKRLSKKHGLGAKQAMRRALELARGTGGAGIVMIMDDANPLGKPVHEASFTEVKALHVFDRWELTPADWVDDLDEEDYGEPKHYYFHPDKPGQTHDRNGDPVGDRIHHTRVLPYWGHEVRRSRRDLYDGWGQPVPDRLQETIKDFNAAVQAVSSSIDEFQYDVLFVDGLADMIAGADGTEEQTGFEKLMDAISTAKSYLNAVVLPGGSSALEKRSIDYSGLLDAIGIIKENLSLGSNIPLTRLFGQTPEGLSSNDETGRDNYFDFVRDIREEKHEPVLLELVGWLNKELDDPHDEERIETHWAKLDESTEAEEAETESKRAQAQQNDVKLGILSPAESKKMRYPQLVDDRSDGSYEELAEDVIKLEEEGVRLDADTPVRASDMQPERQPKAVVGYTNSSPGAEECVDCGWFDGGGSCRMVRGPIAPTGWCRLWNTQVFAAGLDLGGGEVA